MNRVLYLQSGSGKSRRFPIAELICQFVNDFRCNVALRIPRWIWFTEYLDCMSDPLVATYLLSHFEYKMCKHKNWILIHGPDAAFDYVLHRYSIFPKRIGNQLLCAGQFTRLTSVIQHLHTGYPSVKALFTCAEKHQLTMEKIRYFCEVLPTMIPLKIHPDIRNALILRIVNRQIGRYLLHHMPVKSEN